MSDNWNAPRVRRRVFPFAGGRWCIARSKVSDAHVEISSEEEVEFLDADAYEWTPEWGRAWTWSPSGKRGAETGLADFLVGRWPTDAYREVVDITEDTE